MVKAINLNIYKSNPEHYGQRGGLNIYDPSPPLKGRGFEPLGLGCYPSGEGLWFPVSSHPGPGVLYALSAREAGFEPRNPQALDSSQNLITTLAVCSRGT